MTHFNFIKILLPWGILHGMFIESSLNFVHASAKENIQAAEISPEHKASSIITKLFDKDGHVTPSFKEVFKEMKTPKIPQNFVDVFTIVQGKEDASSSWLRKGERYDAQEKDGLKLTQAQAQKIIDFCIEAGFFESIPIPHGPSIKGVLIMGSTLSRMRAQIERLNEEVSQKTWLAAIPVIFIGGERKLAEAAGETEEHLYDSQWIKNSPSPEKDRKPLTDEREMIQLVADQLLSPQFKTVKFVMAEKKPGAERATTMDGFKIWFNQQPEAGLYAIISSNPFIEYQQLVATEAAMIHHRPDVTFIGCGPTIDVHKYSASPIDKAKLLLDNIARIIYELKQLGWK